MSWDDDFGGGGASGTNSAFDDEDESSEFITALPEQMADAARDGDTAAVAAWLDGGGDVNVTTSLPLAPFGFPGMTYDCTLLMAASSAENMPFVQLLLDASADTIRFSIWKARTPKARLTWQ